MNKINWLNSFCLIRNDNKSVLSYIIDNKKYSVDLYISEILHRSLGENLNLIKYYLMTNYSDEEIDIINEILSKEESLIGVLINISKVIKATIDKELIDDLVTIRNNIIISRVKCLNLIETIRNRKIKEYKSINILNEEDRIIINNFIIHKYNLYYIKDRNVLLNFVIPESYNEYMSMINYSEFQNELLNFLMYENVFKEVELPKTNPPFRNYKLRLSLEEATSLVNYFHDNNGIMNEWFLCVFVNEKRANDIVYLNLNRYKRYRENKLKSFIYSKIILLSKPFILKELATDDLIIKDKILYWLTEIIL